MKDFDIWNQLKQDLHQRKMLVYPKERDIWYASMGRNIGFEQNGKGPAFMRPLVIIKVFSPFCFLGVPLSKTKKRGKYYFPFSFKNSISSGLISQIRLWDSKRLSHKIGVMPQSVFGSLKEKIRDVCL